MLPHEYRNRKQPRPSARPDPIGLAFDAHPSHHFIPADDNTECAVCMVRPYNDDAKQPCTTEASVLGGFAQLMREVNHQRRVEAVLRNQYAQAATVHGDLELVHNIGTTNTYRCSTCNGLVMISETNSVIGDCDA